MSMIKQVVETFLELVKIDSPSGQEQKIAEYIVNYLGRIGVVAKQDRYGNVIGQVAGQGEPIVLTGHMDTVEPGREVTPIIENQIIKSDGKTILGADNKAWVAAILAAVTKLSIGSYQLKNVDLIFTRQEEVHNGGAAHLDMRMVRGKRGFSCDDGSSLGAIFLKSPYYIKIDLKVIGRSAHSAEPEKANNALKAASEAIYLLPLGDIGNQTIRNIGIMNSGHVRNTIPGQVDLVAEIRAFSKEYLSLATAEMIKLFRSTAEKHGCSIKKIVELENPGFEIEKSDATVKEAADALRSLNIKPRYEETYGCFDANYFFQRGLHIVNMSDGSVDNHSTTERIAISDLNMLQQLAEKLMLLKTGKIN